MAENQTPAEAVAQLESRLLEAFREMAPLQRALCTTAILPPTEVEITADKLEAVLLALPMFRRSNLTVNLQVLANLLATALAYYCDSPDELGTIGETTMDTLRVRAARVYAAKGSRRPH